MFKYTQKNKFSFYIQYFFYKFVLLWFEVKRPKFIMFFYELIYSVNKIFSPMGSLHSPFKNEIIETRFGVFKIRPGTFDMAIVSPAYERQDINYLSKIIKKLKGENKKILFFDIGAGIGLYSIVLGNMLRSYKNIGIIAIEPEVDKYRALNININLNRLSDVVEPHNIFVLDRYVNQGEFQSSWSENGKCKVATLDSLTTGKQHCYDVVVFKIDTEGSETKVLKGAEDILNSGKEIYILVEDFIDFRITQYLTEVEIDFLHKFTPYNSWWHKESRKQKCAV